MPENALGTCVYLVLHMILFRCIEIGFYKTLSSLYQLTNNNNNNNYTQFYL